MKIKIAVLAALALASMAAWAGVYRPVTVEVIINPNGSGTAFGDTTTAANSNNDVEFIGCGTRTEFDEITGVIDYWGFCQAEDTDGNSAVCETNSRILIESMRSIADRSFITFSWVNFGTSETPDLRCTRVGHSTQSFYLDEIKPSSNNKGKKK